WPENGGAGCAPSTTRRNLRDVGRFFGGEHAGRMGRERRTIEAQRVTEDDAGIEPGHIKTTLAKLARQLALGGVDRATGVYVSVHHGEPDSSRGRRLSRQQFGLVLGHQRVDDLAEGVTFDHLRQLVECEIDAMVTHAPLGKIIGAYALGAVTGADLPSTFGGARSVALLTLEVVEPGAQDRHGLGAISVLRTILLHHDNDAGRD